MTIPKTPLRQWARAATVCGCLALSACTGLEIPFIAAGATASTLAATDRRTLGTQLEDRTIQIKAENRVSQRFGREVRVNAMVYNRRVLLTGDVPDARTKEVVEQEVAQVENVKEVLNELSIDARSSISTRSNDLLITTKVKAALIDAKDVFANSFKITTERGSVYLMGLVTAKEAQRAAEVAATIAGVDRVVKATDTISEAELQNMMIMPTGNRTAESAGSARP